MQVGLHPETLEFELAAVVVKKIPHQPCIEVLGQDSCGFDPDSEWRHIRTDPEARKRLLMRFRRPGHVGGLIVACWLRRGGKRCVGREQRSSVRPEGTGTGEGVAAIVCARSTGESIKRLCVTWHGTEKKDKGHGDGKERNRDEGLVLQGGLPWREILWSSSDPDIRIGLQLRGEP